MRLLSLTECIAANRGALEGGGSTAGIAIYVGRGSSHSWIWLVDALERMGFYDLRFVREADLRSDMDSEILFISGGDTFTLAESIGASRLCNVEKWIAAGGKYIGICAGAYLPLNSSIEPLSGLNLVRGRISNLAKDLPRTISTEGRFSTKYGCSYVFHPVRGPLLLDCLGSRIITPLYGGPAWDGVVEAEVLGRYVSFTPKTFFLADESLARDTIIGRPAALAKKHGEGALYLFGPHFEHPDNPESAVMIGSAIFERDNGCLRPSSMRLQRDPGRPGREASRALRSTISSARIVYRGLEGASWKVGGKMWDHERIGYFVEAIWERLLRARRSDIRLTLPLGVEEGFGRCLELMRSMLLDMKEEKDATTQAELLVRALADSSAGFFEGYFESLRSSRG